MKNTTELVKKRIILYKIVSYNLPIFCYLIFLVSRMNASGFSSMYNLISSKKGKRKTLCFGLSMIISILKKYIYYN